MAVRIIVDSSADLEAETVAERAIEVIPMVVSFHDENFVEGVNLTREEFYEKLEQTDDMPHTSQIPPYDFYNAFKRAVDAGDEAVCIVLSSKISGTYQTAQSVAAGFGNAVCVVDSENAAMGELVLAVRACDLRDEGKSAAEIKRVLDAEKKGVHLVAALDTLEYLKRGGRISAATAAIGGLLSIKPVITMEEGEVVVLGKARGAKQSHKLLRQVIDKIGGIDFTRPHRIGYSGLSSEALRGWAEKNKDLFEGHVNDLKTTVIGPTIGTHIGPGAIGAAFFECR